VSGPWLIDVRATMEMTGPERLQRIDELDSLGAALLLAYLDGRAPGLVDEWFADRERRKAAVAADA
jgi:hypothetical protein